MCKGTRRRVQQQGLRRRPGPVTTRASSVAEAAEVELSAEQQALLEKRKAIMHVETQSSGFVVSEVETTGHQDWHAAKVIAVRDVATGVSCETEVSRECFLSLKTEGWHVKTLMEALDPRVAGALK